MNELLNELETQTKIVNRFANENIQLKQRIDKAIKYIEENFYNENDECWHSDIKKILNILEGE